MSTARPPTEFSGLDAPVVVACSGGADSLALLFLSATAGLEPIAVHVDHGIRPTGDHEASVVRSAADSVAAPFRATRVAVGPGPNLEARARTARYAALERVRVDVGATAVLTGHTADDQAETVLLQLLRGAGSTGLAGIAPRRGTLARPLLGARRADTHAVCRERGFAPVDDPMNADPGFRRVFLRREVLPVLERTARRDLVPVLARQAELLRAESDLLDELAGRELAALGLSDPSARAIGGLAPALGRRVVRAWLGAPPPSFDEVERVLRVARGEVRAAELTGGRRIDRRAGRLVLRAESTSTRQVTARHAPGERRAVPDVVVPFPGFAEGVGLRIESWIERSAPARWPDGRWTCVLDAASAGEEGRLVATGAIGRAIGVLTRVDGAELWRVGYGVGASARITPLTRRFLWVIAEHVTGEPA